MRAVAVDLRDVREEVGIRYPTVEEGHLVTALERRLDEGSPDEPRPSEDEEA